MAQLSRKTTHSKFKRRKLRNVVPLSVFQTGRIYFSGRALKNAIEELELVKNGSAEPIYRGGLLPSMEHAHALNTIRRICLKYAPKAIQSTLQKQSKVRSKAIQSTL